MLSVTVTQIRTVVWGHSTRPGFAAQCFGEGHGVSIPIVGGWVDKVVSVHIPGEEDVVDFIVVIVC